MKILLITLSALLIFKVPVWSQESTSEVSSSNPQETKTMSEDESDEDSQPSVEEIVKMRDPFRKLVELFEKDEIKPKTDLEKYPSDQFKMIGVVTGPGETRAMLRGPNGNTYFVTKNMSIGLRNGKVWKITAKRILIKEFMRNLLGKEEEIITQLSLPEDSSLGIFESAQESSGSQDSLNGASKSVLEETTRSQDLNRDSQ